MLRVLCFGDSNTYGYDPRGFFGDRYAPADRWPELLAGKTRWNVINLGQNGREIPRDSAPLPLLAECAPEDCILIMLGTNDLLQGTSAAETGARMEAFLNALAPHCPRILLIAPPPMKRGAWVASDALPAQSIRLAGEYSQLARRLEIPFIDTRTWDIPLAFDGVHFTGAGHHIFADRLLECLALSC